MGCENLIVMKDMYDDQLLLRQVKRATHRERADDSDDEDDAPRGTQRNRPEELDDESAFMDVDDDEERRRSVKKERVCRAPTLTQVSTDGEDEEDEDE